MHWLRLGINGMSDRFCKSKLEIALMLSNCLDVCLFFVEEEEEDSNVHQPVKEVFFLLRCGCLDLVMARSDETPLASPSAVAFREK